jgi:hypothetical protein
MLALGNATHERGGDLRRFDTKHHPGYGGIDVHARSMDVCILSQAGEMLLHRQMHAAPAPFLKAMAPARAGLVVAVEGLFTWYWLADWWAEQGRPVVLGHALSMQASPGGKAKHEKIDAPKMAALRRGGLLPHASVDPAALRATRDLLRRRTHLLRTRAARLAHGHTTHAPDHRPAIGQKIADQANREGVAHRCTARAGHKTIAVDLALITSDAARLSELERYRLNTATPHEAKTLDRLHTVPGMGQILRLVRRYAIHDIDRFPRVQDCVSSGRLVTCATASAGTRVGPAGQHIGTAHLKGAVSAAAALLLRHHAPGPK